MAARLQQAFIVGGLRPELDDGLGQNAPVADSNGCSLGWKVHDEIREVRLQRDEMICCRK